MPGSCRARRPGSSPRSGRCSSSALVRESRPRRRCLISTATARACRPVGVPDLVVFPETNEEVAFILALCNEHRFPVTPFGAGSSLEGQLAALAGGGSPHPSRFDKVLDVSPDSLDCRVQAGVTREVLNAEIRDTGLFFPVDPGANA